MHNNREPLATEVFDILIIGAGIFGACVAWSASLRGYSVAVIDKGDFGGATSANHYKFIHGGIRYLQHLDIARVRESSREKSALIRIAPHLAYPLPIVFPTYGHGRRGKEIMRAAMLTYDILTMDRNRGIKDVQRQTPGGAIINRDQVLELFPNISKVNLTGAAVFYDGQMYNPARLVLAFLQSATSKGAIAANYVEAKQLLLEDGRVNGSAVEDLTTGRHFDIRSRVVVNAAGPWAGYILKNHPEYQLSPEPSFSRDLAFVVNKSVCVKYALGCQVATQDSDALLDRGGRHLFLVPWRGMTLVGVWHKYSTAHPDEMVVSRTELKAYLDEINGAYPGLELGLDDISMINTGHILFSSEEDQGSGREHSFAKRSLLFDHMKQGLEGLISVVGARATVARGVAEKVLKIVDRKLGGRAPRVGTKWLRIQGGSFDNFAELTKEILSKLPAGEYDLAEAIAHNYGSKYGDLFGCAMDSSGLEPIGFTNVLKAEMIHAVRHEMATSLEDIVLRRTEFGTGSHPGSVVLEEAADIVGKEFGWDSEERAAQVRHVHTILAANGPWKYTGWGEDIKASKK